MIVVLKHNVPEEKRNQLINWLRNQNIDVHPSLGEYQTVLGLVGDTSRIDMSLLESLDIVDSVKRVSDPFKCCNRKFHPDDTVVSVGDAKFGGGHFAMIAGPCSVESEEQIVYVAKAVKAAGAQLLRGGAFKPRTSPYDFQGLHGEGIRLLEIAKQETGLPIVTELMNIKHLPLFDNVDVIQIGARNMQNYDLLKEMGDVYKRQVWPLSSHCCSRLKSLCWLGMPVCRISRPQPLMSPFPMFRPMRGMLKMSRPYANMA